MSVFSDLMNAMDCDCYTKLGGALCIADPPLNRSRSSTLWRYAKLLPIASRDSTDFIHDGEFQLIILQNKSSPKTISGDATTTAFGGESHVKNASFAFQLDGVKRDLFDFVKANRKLEINLHPFHCMSPSYLGQVNSDDKIIETNDCWYARGFLVTCRQKTNADVTAAEADAFVQSESNADGLVSFDNFNVQLREFRDGVDKVSGKHDFGVALELCQTAAYARDEGDIEGGRTFRWIASQPDVECWTGNDQQKATGVSDRRRFQVMELTADQILSEVTTINTDGISSSMAMRVLLHPAFVDRRNNFVFHSLAEVSRVLAEAKKVCCGDITPFNELLKHLEHVGDDSTSADLLQVEQVSSRTGHPFIVVEGLDATGKSTVVSNLAKLLGACQLYSPPASIQHLRETFDSMPSTVRRAFYSLGNYLAGQTARDEARQQPVVLDRYWHSTAAYAIAEETSMPEQDDHWVYRWPEDLIRPTIVILLVVSEEVRAERMKHRVATEGTKLTAEEVSLRDDDDLKKRVLQSYRRMHNPGVIEVSAEGTPAQVLERVTVLLRQKNVI